jgi:hypothetical protein
MKAAVITFCKDALAFAALQFAACLCLLAALLSFVRPVPDGSGALPRMLYALLNILSEPGFSLSLWLRVPNALALEVALGNSVLWGVVFAYMLAKSRSRRTTSTSRS